MIGNIQFIYNEESQDGKTVAGFCHSITGYLAKYEIDFVSSQNITPYTWLV